MNKIPVQQTIAEAYRFTFLGLERVIGLIWLPTVILTVGSYFVMSPYLNGMASAIDSGDLAQQGPHLAMMFVFELAALVLIAMIAVAINREILNPLKRPLFLRFGLGGTELRLVGALIGLYFLVLVFVIVCAIIAVALGMTLDAVLPAAAALEPGTKRGLGLAVLIGLLLSPVLIYILARLSFLVVPCVVMEGNFGIERSWQLTKGNVWRIIGISLALAVPVLIVSLLGQLLILGPDYFNPHLELLHDQAAQAKHNAENMRLLASKLPLLVGFSFLMAPFFNGLFYSAPAFAYRALMARDKPPA